MGATVASATIDRRRGAPFSCAISRHHHLNCRPSRIRARNEFEPVLVLWLLTKLPYGLTDRRAAPLFHPARRARATTTMAGGIDRLFASLRGVVRPKKPTPSANPLREITNATPQAATSGKAPVRATDAHVDALALKPCRWPCATVKARRPVHTSTPRARVRTPSARPPPPLCALADS